MVASHCCSFFVLRNTYGQYTSCITSPLHNDSKYGFLCYRYWQFCRVFHWDLYSFFGPSSLCSFNIDDKKCLIPEIIFNLNLVWQGFFCTLSTLTLRQFTLVPSATVLKLLKLSLANVSRA